MQITEYTHRVESSHPLSFRVKLSNGSSVKINSGKVWRKYFCVAIKYFKTEAQGSSEQYFSHQNNIAKTPFTHFVPLRRSVSFFLCMLN